MTHDHYHEHGPDGAHAHHPAHHLPMSYHEKLTTALLELLVEKQLISAEAVQREIEAIEGRTPAIGARVVREPRAVLAEFGLQLPADVTVRVLDSTANTRYFVIPMRPAGTDGWSEEQLRELPTRDAMVGTAIARTPAEAAR